MEFIEQQRGGMEKLCEFCMALSPVVYCKSDAAHLCLCCDAKVHSANALSYRHPRTLVCQSCRCRPSLVRCIDHEKFMCESCDSAHHAYLQHRRNVIGCYVGCPSAKDLAELWGFDPKELESSCSESEGGPSSRATKVVKGENIQKGSYLILKQIMDLETLQLAEGIDNPCLIHIKERTSGIPFRDDTMGKEHKMINSHLDQFNRNGDLQNKGSPLDDKTGETLSTPFSQLENWTNTGNPMNGDSFWQYKSPLHNNEIWLQNMQDLGVCDEVRSFDDVNIPDVDLTFRNFEELFGSEQEMSRAVVDKDNVDSYFVNKHPSFGKLDQASASTIEEFDDVVKEINPSYQVHQSQSNHRHPIRPSYSTSSFSVSRITGEGSGSEYKDDILNPTFSDQNTVNTMLDGKEKALTRYKEKKVLRHAKQAHYTSPRSNPDFKKRGRLLKVEGLDDSADVTRSF